MVMKILEGKNTLRTVDSGAPLSDEETLERLEVPDDLSGLADVPSIGEPGGVVAAEPRRAATMVRWLRWVPLLVLAIAGVAVAVILTADDAVAPVNEVPWVGEADGPGSNSLNAAWLTGTETPWLTANAGPGGHTMNVPPVVLAESPWAVNDGPGGYTLNVPPVTSAESPWAANDGPGGYTLNVPPVTSAEMPWAANDGPGGYTLNVPPVTLTEMPWAVNDGPGGHTLNTVEP